MLLGSLAHGQTTTLTNASQVMELTSAQAREKLPVRLKGIVTSLAGAAGRALFLADATSGIYLLADQNLFARYHRGDVLEIEGVTDPGEFAPIVRVSQARKEGTGALPEPRRVTYQQLITGSLDAQWVEIDGVVRGTIEPEVGSKVWRIHLSADGGVVPVRGDFPRDPLIQVDAEVRVQAICLYQFNRRGQVLTPVLSVPSGMRVQVLKPAPTDPFEAPVRSTTSLLQYSPERTFDHRVRVRGVVLHAQPGSTLWIRDASSALLVQTRQNEELQAGDEIDVLGFPSYGSYAPMMEDAVFRTTGSTHPPAAVVLTNAAAAFDHEEDLVQMDALLVDVQPVLEGLVFTFDLDETVFKGVMKISGSVPEREVWLPGCKVRVTGICTLLHDNVRPMMGVWQPQSFQLLLRSASDLVALQSPPWWTPGRIIYLLGIAAAGLLLAIGVLTLFSRHHLKEQAHHRAMAETEFTAILKERNRMAREIHDALAQGLAATAVQLRLARKMAANDVPSANRHLDVALQLVGESLQEARNSIWNTPSQILETHDLEGALDNILRQMSEGTDLRAKVEVRGQMQRFAPVMENNLLRVGQEAITNAIKHANAKTIKVTLDFSPEQFRLRVRDDGQGFDPDHPRANGVAGFGLVGMKERAVEMRGHLTVSSEPARGTEVSLVVPLTGKGILAGSLES